MAHPPSSGKEQSSKSSSKKLDLKFLTLFPEIFENFFKTSLIGKACDKGIVAFQTLQIRDHSTDKHRRVDDTPYGGGVGMLMKVDVLYEAWKAACGNSKPLTILLTPQGEVFNQNMAKDFAKNYSEIIFVCGHYEGVDERFIELCVDREISIGDYVLTGGEVPAMVIADALVRLVPGVVAKEESIASDSLEGGVLKYPQYTRPPEFMGRKVPDVLLSGNHAEIERWRKVQSQDRTKKKRPDLK
jgi:tRNA (guanine37-N1)-methyltransferase